MTFPSESVRGWILLLAVCVAGGIQLKTFFTPTHFWWGGASFFAWLALFLYALDRFLTAKERLAKALTERDRALEAYERTLGGDE